MIVMNITDVYACVFLGAFVFCAIFYQLVQLAGLCATAVRRISLRFLTCRFVVDRHRFFGPITPAQVLLVTSFIACVAVASAVGVSDAAEAGARSGTLCVINLVPLFLTTQFSHAAEILNLGLRNARLAHRVLGLVCLAGALVHVIVSGTGVALTGQLGLCGLLSGLSICLLATLPALRSVAYETFFLTHVALGVLLATSLWLHLSPGGFNARYYIAAAGGTLTITTLQRALRIAWSNALFFRSSGLSRITRIDVQEYKVKLRKITVRLVREWAVRPGQYVYIQVPSLGLTSWLQSHPFMVARWTRSGSGSELKRVAYSSRATELELIVYPRSGWTRKLDEIAKSGLLAVVDGPYGAVDAVGEYGTVLMLATGMGIFAHIPYIGSLLSGSSTGDVKTHRIRVVWQVDQASRGQAQELMDEFLVSDAKRLSLDISVYHPELQHGDGYRFGERVETIPGRVDCEALVRDELKRRIGRLLISMSAEGEIRDGVRRALAGVSAEELAGEVKVVELPFQPPDQGLSAALA